MKNNGGIVFFTNNRPATPLDIYSRPVEPTPTPTPTPTTRGGSKSYLANLHNRVVAISDLLVPTTQDQDEVSMTDETSYNYNGQAVPPAALKTILKHPKLEFDTDEKDVDSGRVSGTVFVSERTSNLETLHLALHFHDESPGQVKVLNLADVLGTFKGVRMEDSGCFAGEYLIYVTTKDPAPDRHQPWTAVYRTHLLTGETERLTPPFQADLNPSVSPSGKMIAVASFQKRGGWNGETESLKTDIFVINIEQKPFHRTLVVNDGGWPSWGSNDILFFHHKVDNHWGVFRADIRNVLKAEAARMTPNKGGHQDTSDSSSTTRAIVSRVTPKDVNAMTPAAISATKVAVATISKESSRRHIEIFDVDQPQQPPTQLTCKYKPQADHFNPFVIMDNTNTMKRIGYHRCNKERVPTSLLGFDIERVLKEVQVRVPTTYSSVIGGILNHGKEIETEVPRQIEKLETLNQNAQLFRVSGMLPAFSRDGSKLAFVDNKLKNVWLAHAKDPLRLLYKAEDQNKVFSIVWNQNPGNDTLYVCAGPSSSAANDTVHIWAIVNASSCTQSDPVKLTKAFNNAFPSTSPDGKKLVFQSTRDGGNEKYKNLYIMQDAQTGENGEGKITRLTKGPWVDTHCQWSPKDNWIVFSSNRDSYEGTPPQERSVDDLGYYGVFLVKASNRNVVVRVMASGSDIAGHLKSPFFSPDGKSIAITSDLAALSVDPIALPLLVSPFAVPCGEIFTVEIDPTNIEKNKDVKKFNRITHSRFGNSTATWTMLPTDQTAPWNLVEEPKPLPARALNIGNLRKNLIKT